MTAAFSFGPLGDMSGLRVAPTTVGNAREIRETITSRGVRWAQRARRNPRTWVVSRPWQEPAFIQALALAAYGVGGEMFLYDRACARQNMLPARYSTGTGPLVPVRSTMPNGKRTLMGSVTWQSVSVPLLAGRTYTISGWTTSSQSPLAASWPGLTGMASLPVPVEGFTVLTITPQEDGMLTLGRLQDVAAVRVHEGIPDGRFYLTEGTPCQVAVADPERAYQLVTDTETRIDFTVTLYEVGNTGDYAGGNDAG